jgi:hypothetical protein
MRLLVKTGRVNDAKEVSHAFAHLMAAMMTAVEKRFSRAKKGAPLRKQEIDDLLQDPAILEALFGQEK